MSQSVNDREEAFLRSLTDALKDLGDRATVEDVAEYQEKRLQIFEDLVEKHLEPNEELVTDWNWRMAKITKLPQEEDYV